MTRTFSAVAVTFCALTAVAGITSVRADGDKVAFPKDYAKGMMYMSQDMADRKEFREFYITSPSFAAAKKGEPLPSGTVVTLVRYNVQLDDRGNPVKDANGHFIKTEVNAYRVMEKRTGWGSEYPASKRNGEWEFQTFLPDGKVDQTAKLDSCFQCHKNGDSVNFMFTANELKSAAK
jgi:Cytochrome P460